MLDFVDRLSSCNFLSSLLKTNGIAESTDILIDNIFRKMWSRTVNFATVTFDYSDNILIVNAYTPIRTSSSLNNSIDLSLATMASNKETHSKG